MIRTRIDVKVVPQPGTTPPRMGFCTVLPPGWGQQSALVECGAQGTHRTGVKSGRRPDLDTYDVVMR